MRNKYIIFLSIISCILLYLLEQVLEVNYFVKTAAKIFFFIGVPLIYFKWVKREGFKTALNLKRLNKKDFTLGLLLGFLSFLIVLVAYIILRNEIDLHTIKNDLNQLNITTTNFIFIGLYIVFVNSLLEEFFFRGFIFLNLYQTNKIIAYLFSAGLFAIYHISIFKTWFNLAYILLALLGLLLIGLVFNYLDTLTKNFLNSWIVHILADIAVIIIGLRVFEII